MSPHHPPRFTERLLGWVLPDDTVGRSILGDMAEEYRSRAPEGVSGARWWYRREAAGVITRSLFVRINPFGERVNARARIKGRERRRGDPMWQTMWRDVRYSVRALVAAPRFTLIAGLTLALGIGSNTAIFSAVNGVLLRPLPYAESDRIVGLWHGAPDLGYDQFGTSPGIFHQYLVDNQVFEGMSLYGTLQVNLTEEGEAERVDAVASTPALFEVLGVRPLRGRTYTEAEASSEPATLVAVLGHGLWQRRYGGDPSVLGRTIRVNGESREIVGVMPPGFDFGGTGGSAEIFLPLQIDLENGQPGAFSFQAVARLREGVTPDAARAQMESMLVRVRERWADEEALINFMDAGGFRPITHTLQEEIVGDLRRPLWILLGTVGFVLLIACANVANLFLVRAEGRHREMAVRAALGATRGRLIRESLTESLLLAAMGGAAGLAVAWVATPLLLRLAPPELPRLDEVAMEGSVLTFTLGITALAALLFGTAPALRHNIPSLLSTLRFAGRGTTRGRDRHHLRNALVVGQTALALILLVGSGLLVKSFREIRQSDPGFDTEGLLTFRLALSAAEYPGALAPAAFHQELLDRLRALPGVETAGGISELPLAGGPSGTAFDIEEFPAAPGELPPMFWFKNATPGYFDAMGISLVAGRLLERADHEQTFGNVVVTKSLADRIWPDGEALGKRLRITGDTAELAWQTIVGVVENTRDMGFREDYLDMIYRPLVSAGGDDGWSVPQLTYVLRSQAPELLVGDVRRIVREMNANLPITAIETMERVAADSVVRLSFTMLSLAIAAFMALVLGAVGLYGVLSYVVTQRTQEIGVRMALGAQTGQVQAMVVASGARLAGVGLLLGIGGAAALTGLLQGLLFGTEPLDPATFVGMSGVLLLVGIVASWLPARRAARVDPVASMRAE